MGLQFKSLKKDPFRWLYPLLLFLPMFACWWQVVFARFNFDDVPLIIENPYLRSLSGLIPLLKTGRPIRAITFWIDYHLWGLDARGFHFTNLLLHFLAVLIGYFLLLKLIKKRWVAFLSCFIFSIHPVTSEAVIGIAHRKEILCLLFLFLSLLAFLKEGKRRWIWVLLSFFFYLLAIFSKQVAITFPLLAGLIYFLFKKPAIGFKRLLLELVPFVIFPLLAVFLAFSDFKLFAFFPPPDVASYKYIQVLATQMSCFPRYLKLCFFPAHLQIDYYVELLNSFFAPKSLLGIFTFIACFVLEGFLLKKKSLFAFAFGWILINLLPVMNWIPANYFLAERYLYIPLFGVGLTLVLPFEKAGAVFLELIKEKQFRYIIFGNNLLLLFIIFSMEIFYYHQHLWYGIKPTFLAINYSSLISGALGSFIIASLIFFSNDFLQKRAKLLQIIFYIMAISLGYFLALFFCSRLGYGFWGIPHPNIEKIYSSWLNALARNAVNPSRLFLSLSRPFGKNWVELFNIIIYVFILQGVVLWLYNWYAKRLFKLRSSAFFSWLFGFILLVVMMIQLNYRIRDWGWDINLWKATIRENPLSFTAWNNLGRAYLKIRKKYALARACFIMAHSLKPWRIEPLMNLGNLMLWQNRLDESEHYYRWVIKLNPFYYPARINIGNCLVMKGELKKAIKEYLEALRIKPDSFQASYNLAWCFYQLGDLKQAYFYCQKALSLAPNHQPSKALLFQIEKALAQPSRQ